VQKTQNSLTKLRKQSLLRCFYWMINVNNNSRGCSISGILSGCGSISAAVVRPEFEPGSTTVKATRVDLLSEEKRKVIGWRTTMRRDDFILVVRRRHAVDSDSCLVRPTARSHDRRHGGFGVNETSCVLATDSWIMTECAVIDRCRLQCHQQVIMSD